MEGKEGYSVSSVHLKMIKERKKLYCNGVLDSPENVVKMVSSLFKDVDREKMIIISTAANLEPIAYEIIAVGGTSMCCVDLKSIFKHALLANASNIICVHNHPSGNIKPSIEDEIMTEKIRKACAIMDIELVDHIVYGSEDTYYSFSEHNWKRE